MTATPPPPHPPPPPAPMLTALLCFSTLYAWWVLLEVYPNWTLQYCVLISMTLDLVPWEFYLLVPQCACWLTFAAPGVQVVPHGPEFRHSAHWLKAVSSIDVLLWYFPAWVYIFFGWFFCQSTIVQASVGAFRVQVMENWKSGGILSYNFKAWKSHGFFLSMWILYGSM